MPNGKKKKVSTKPNDKNSTFTVKSDPDKVVKKSPRKKITSIAANTGKRQGKGEKDGRMAARRQEALDKEVKNAGGTQKYLIRKKEINSNMFKYGNKYYNKNTKLGQAMLAKKKREQSKKK